MHNFGYSLFLVTCDLTRFTWMNHRSISSPNELFFGNISFLCKINIWFIRKIAESILEIMEFSRTGMKWNMKIILSKYMTMSHCTSWHPTLVNDESAWINETISGTKMLILYRKSPGYRDFIETVLITIWHVDFYQSNEGLNCDSQSGLSINLKIQLSFSFPSAHILPWA